VVGRSLRVFFGFAFLLCAPLPASAFDWAWLDELSGPAFGGPNFEWRAYCVKQKRVPDKALGWLRQVRVALGARLAEPMVKQRYDALVDAARNGDFTGTAVGSVEYALDQLRTTLPPGAAPLPMIPPELRPPQMVGAPGLAVIVSLCSFKDNEDRKGSLDVTFGLWRPYNTGLKPFDFKPLSGEADAAKNRLFVIEPSYSHRVNNFLEVGAGAGIAFFSSQRRESFTRLIVEPVRVDLRPFAFWSDHGRAARVVGDMMIFRLGYYIFPQGFDAGTFDDTHARIPAELVPHFDLVIDTEPLLRRLTRSPD
jgi:hypothetical protein